jgi:uncharacterized protein (TIGR00369 family)
MCEGEIEMTTWATTRLDQLVAGTKPPPVVQTMRLGTLAAWGEGWIKKRWDPSTEMLNSDGSLFGGLIAALADQSLAFAAMTVVPGDKFFRTTNLTVNFFKLGRAHPLEIEAKVVSQSRQLIHVRAEFFDPDRSLLAEASAQQILQAFE